MTVVKGQAMTPPYFLHDGLGYRLSRASKVFQARLESALAPHGLSRLKWCVLSGVALEGHKSPSALATHIGITRPAVSRLLRAMADDGFVVQAMADDDRRSREIELTKLGKTRLATCRPLVAENDLHFSNKLSADEKAQLSLLLNRLTEGESPKLDTL